MSGFKIDGVEYEVPTFDTFDMDEAMLFYEYAGFPIEDLALADEDSTDTRLRNPGVVKALMQVAYQRGNPKLSKAKAAGLIGSSNFVEALVALVGDADDGPPEMTEEQTNDSVSRSGSSENSSGRNSLPSSDEPAATPEPTGTTA